MNTFCESILNEFIDGVVMFRISNNNQLSFFKDEGIALRSNMISLLIGDFFESLTREITDTKLVSLGARRSGCTDLIAKHSLLEVKASSRPQFYFSQRQMAYYANYIKNWEAYGMEVFFFLYFYKKSPRQSFLTLCKNEHEVFEVLMDGVSDLWILDYQTLHDFIHMDLRSVQICNSHYQLVKTKQLIEQVNKGFQVPAEFLISADFKCNFKISFRFQNGKQERLLREILFQKSKTKKAVPEYGMLPKTETKAYVKPEDTPF